MIRRLGTCFFWIMLVVLVGCQRAPAPPPFETSARPALTFINPQGPIAAAQRAHLIRVFLLLLIVVLPVFILTPLIVWRYRLRGSARYTPKWSYSGPLEVAVWGVPIAIVTVLAIWVWHDTHRLDPYAPLSPALDSAADPPLRIEVIGYDWKWLFIYPELNIASIGVVAFPAGQPLAFTLTSDTVMQSFFISALGSQIYAMPGMVTHLHLLANAPGTFRGENTQYNGTGFAEQDFAAVAMTAKNFKAWVAKAETAGIPMSPDVYTRIADRTTLSETRKALGLAPGRDQPLIFTDLPHNLFDTVVQSFAMGPMKPTAIPPANAGH